MELQKSKAIMQIQLDQNDSENIAQDLKEYAITLCAPLGHNTSEILDEMTSYDVKHMVNVFKKYFGDYVEVLESDHVIISRNK